MTIKQRIKQCLKTFNCDNDNLEKIVALAYYMGKESHKRGIGCLQSIISRTA